MKKYNLKSKITFVLFFLIISQFSYAQWYISPTGSGNGDGTSWDDAEDKLLDVLYNAAFTSGDIIYLKEGMYTENPDARDYGTESTELSNLPDSKNVVVIGGFSSSLTGTSRCGYNPALYHTILKANGTQSGGESWFRVNGDDGNLTVRGVHFIDGANDNITLGSAFSINNKTNGIYIFEDIYLEGHDTDPQIGAFYVNGTSSGNTITFDRILGVNNNQALFFSTNANTTNNTININNSTFRNNNHMSDRAGVIYIEGKSESPNNVNISYSNFCDNSNNQDAGAIKVEDAGILNIDNSNFVNNSGGTGSGDQGGAIFLRAGSKLTLSGNNTFTGNDAVEGGAIYALESEIDISGSCTFESNVAHKVGGAIFINGETNDGDRDYSIINATFHSNTAAEGGGAVYIQGGVGAQKPYFEGNIFCSNSTQDASSYGGAIAVVSTNSSLHSKLNKYIGNTAERNGGAVAIRGTGQGRKVADPHFEPYVFEEDYFYDNRTISQTSSHGGAIYLSRTGSKKNVLIYKSDFKNNLSGSNLIKGLGGAIFFNRDGATRAHGEIRECRFEANRAMYGGAVASSNQNSLFVVDSRFFLNMAFIAGGAIYKEDGHSGSVYIADDGTTGKTFIVELSEFHSNEVGSAAEPSIAGGGAINTSNEWTDKFYVSQSNFYNNKVYIGPNNKSTRGGGAIRASDNALFNSVTFLHNQVNDSSLEPHSNGGSDVQDYSGNQGLSFTNSKMQLGQSDYKSQWSFTGCSFNENSMPPALPTTITTIICPSLVQLACPDVSINSLFVDNPPTTATLTANCNATSGGIIVNLSDLNENDAPYDYTWTYPDMSTETGSAYNATDLNLSNLTQPGTYILEFTDKNGCEVMQEITLNHMNCAILPVEFSSFTVKKGNDMSIIKWSTAQEINNELFIVEKSTDGTAFSPIGQVKGLGNSSSIQVYNFMDENPVVGKNYYRIKQQDYDGNYSLSSVKYVIYSEENGESLTVYPNPATNMIYIDCNVATTISIYNMQGKIVKNLETNSIRITEVDIKDLTPGVYILKTKNGEHAKIMIE